MVNNGIAAGLCQTFRDVLEELVGLGDVPAIRFPLRTVRNGEQIEHYKELSYSELFDTVYAVKEQLWKAQIDQGKLHILPSFEMMR